MRILWNLMAKRPDPVQMYARRYAEQRFLEMKEEAEALFADLPALKKDIKFKVTLPAHLVRTKVRAKEAIPPERPDGPDNRKVRGYVHYGAKSSGHFATARRKGTRKMSVAQREEVSARMKKYWAGKRKAKGAKKR